MKWEDIRRQYAGQWVLIEYQQLDEQLNVVEGEVVAHSSEKEEMYKYLLQTQGKNIAIEYAGDFPPSELFHYTSSVGLKGILESQTLWATHYLYLNDANEIRHIRKVLENYLLPTAKQFKSEKAPEEVAKTLVDGMYSSSLGDKKTTPLVELYTTSFCRADSDKVAQHGLLSQWRGYGQDGGYAIVFDKQKLDLFCREEGKKWEYILLHGGDIVYCEEKIQEKLGHHLETIKNGLIESHSTSTKEPLDQTLGSFLVVACLYKDWGFQEEEEVRIFAAVRNSKRVKELSRKQGDSLKEKIKKEKPKKFFVRSGTLVPYINLFECITSIPTKPLPIKRIIIGPHQEQEKRKQSVEILLNQLGIEVDEVSAANISYLGK